MTAQPLMSPEAVARWWGIEPVLQSAPGGTRGTCALGGFRAGPEDIDVAGEADPDTHIISIGAAGRSSQEYFGNGRLHFKRQCRPGLLNIDLLAGVAGCSKTHFSRAFRRLTGMPPFQWLLVRRIERVKAFMLDDHRLSLAEVALTIGFSAQSQFTTAFQRVTGTTPGVWRRGRVG